MRDKGYTFPLYSLDLVLPDGAPLDEARFSIFSPPGRLQVRAALRRRGEVLSSAACERAVIAALAYHRRTEAGFSACGFCREWTGSLRYWLGQLKERTEEGWAWEVELRGQDQQRRGSVAQARDILRRLQLAARAARLEGLGLPARLPRSEGELLSVLAEIAGGLSGPLPGPLADGGFGPAQQAELLALCAGLRPAQDRVAALSRSRRRVSDIIAVLRGALLGDLRMLCQASPAVSGGPGGLSVSQLFREVEAARDSLPSRRVSG